MRSHQPLAIAKEFFMPSIDLLLEPQGDACWPDVAEKLANHPEKVIHLGEGSPPIRIAALRGGMQSGRTSLAIRLDLPDGSTVIAETSLALFTHAAAAFVARFPNG
jgi:hypothetical protein